MHKLEARITSQGGKRNIYALQELLEQVLSQFSVNYDIAITDSHSVIETKSVSLTKEEVKPDDIIDTELTGDDLFEMVEKGDSDGSGND